MYLRNYRDIFAGALLAAVGLFVGIYASRNYAVGTLSQMGPGMFPVWLGFLLAALGLAILVSGVLQAGPEVKPHYRPFAAIVAGLATFAVTVDVLGMIPAIVLLVVASSLADGNSRPLPILILAACLAAVAFVIFRIGLGVPIEPLRWPF